MHIGYLGKRCKVSSWNDVWTDERKPLQEDDRQRVELLQSVTSPFNCWQRRFRCFQASLLQGIRIGYSHHKRLFAKETVPIGSIQEAQTSTDSTRRLIRRFYCPGHRYRAVLNRVHRRKDRGCEACKALYKSTVFNRVHCREDREHQARKTPCTCRLIATTCPFVEEQNYSTVGNDTMKLYFIWAPWIAALLAQKWHIMTLSQICILIKNFNQNNSRNYFDSLDFWNHLNRLYFTNFILYSITRFTD